MSERTLTEHQKNIQAAIKAARDDGFSVGIDVSYHWSEVSVVQLDVVQLDGSWAAIERWEMP